MAIITLSDLKSFLGISDNSKDANLQIFVDSANEFVPRYCRRVFDSTAYVKELYDGPGTNKLILNQYPIISIEGIWEYGDPVSERGVYTSILDIDGYYIKDPRSGIIYHGLCWQLGRGSIEVSYTAGYATIPADLKHATLLVAAYFDNTAAKQGIRSESLGSYGYSLAGDIGSDLVIPDATVRNVLERYKRKTVGEIF